MATGTYEYGTEAERASIERAIAFVSEMHDLASAAPPGQVLDRCAQRAVDRGRDLLRETLQAAVRTRIDAADANEGRRGGARAGARSAKSGGAGGTR